MNNYGQPLSLQYGNPNDPDALDSAAAIANAEGPWQQTDGQDFGGEQARQQQAAAQQQQGGPDPMQMFALLQQLAGELRGQGTAVSALNSQLQYLSRQVAKSANTGAAVPPEIQAQIAQVVKDAEERRLEGMTDEEKAEYWRKQAKSERKAAKRAAKAAQQGQGQGDGEGDDDGVDFVPGAIFTPDSPVTAAVSQQYATQILPVLQAYAEAQGFTLTEEIRQFLDRDPVDVHEDGTVRWDTWLAGAKPKLQQIGQAVKAQQQGSPARNPANARTLQPAGRPSGGTPNSEPDFFKTDMDTYIQSQLSRRRR